MQEAPEQEKFRKPLLRERRRTLELRQEIGLKGYLPSEREHQILLQILEDRPGLRRIVDEIAVNRQLWEREDRAPGRSEEDEKAAEDQTLLEREREEIYRSIEEGTPTLAPDELMIQEKPE